MKNVVYLLLGVMILLFVQACQDKHAKNYNQTTLVDQDGLLFIQNGLEGGLTEIKASGLAITNSSNQQVIGLAKMMIDDHTKAGQDLKKIEGDKLIVEKDSINADHRKMIDELSKKTGPAFDKAYIKMMIADHEQAVDLFTNASQNTDIEIRNFAAKTLPTIKMHLDSANVIGAALK
jgi:putative membrane protein